MSLPVRRRSYFCSLDRRAHAVLGLAFSIAALAALAGCGGGAPLLHQAQVLRPGDARAGVGLSGQLALAKPAATRADATLQDLAIRPAIAPWVSGRIGIEGDNEAGLTYSGRALRLDGRHAFSLGKLLSPGIATFSLGLGASALRAQAIGEGTDGSAVYGGGVDVPMLFGYQNASDLYAIWLGPRLGIELLRGRIADDAMRPGALVDVNARHGFAGFTLGAKAGFRHIHVALEVNGAYHRADGAVGGLAIGQNQFTLTPAGALLVSF